jgi:hypothetical protein
MKKNLSGSEPNSKDKKLHRLLLFKPGAPKWMLMLLGAALWGFAAYRILSIGIVDLEKYQNHEFLNYLLGIAGFIPFFLGVFRKVSFRYFNRIVNLPQKRPCLFAFFDLRGYLIMSFMITLGVLLNHWKVVSDEYKGIFFISLGLSLLASSVVFISEGFKFITHTTD